MLHKCFVKEVLLLEKMLNCLINPNACFYKEFALSSECATFLFSCSLGFSTASLQEVKDLVYPSPVPYAGISAFTLCSEVT